MIQWKYSLFWRPGRHTAGPAERAHLPCEITKAGEHA
jgi:hypothetical protein